NPGNYSWGGYDWLLAKAKELHWPVLLTVTGPVPKWATSTHRDYLTHPSAAEFQQFMTAVGRHYASQVAFYSIWNEANHPAFLRPQFNANGTPASPRIYRALYQAGYAGLQAAGLRNPQVLMGETAPTGYGSVNVRREGRNALLHDVAQRPVFLTEFGVQSRPNRFLGVPVGQQAEWDAIAERIAWSNPRVAAFSQYLLRDDPLGGAPGASVHGGTIGFQTGLEYLNGKLKPLYFG